MKYPSTPSHISPRQTRVAVLAADRDAQRRQFLIFALVGLACLCGTLLANAGEPVEVTASDLVDKVYGVADPSLGRDACREAAAENFEAAPVAKEGAEWMSEDEGFQLSYAGQSPEAEGMVRYDKNNDVAGYGYIFYFPYEAHQRDEANSAQCQFCTALLGELNDMSSGLGDDPLSDELFDVSGMVKGKYVQLTLTEDIDAEPDYASLQAGAIDPNQSGGFILVMSVIPSAEPRFTADLQE